MTIIRFFNNQILEDAEPVGDSFASAVSPDVRYANSDFSDFPSGELSVQDLRKFESVELFSTYYYSSNDLLIELLPGESGFTEIIDAQTNGEVNLESEIWIKNRRNSDGTYSYDKMSFHTALFGLGRNRFFQVTSLNSERTKLQVTIKEDVLSSALQRSRLMGRDIPEFGIVGLAIPFIASNGRRFKQCFYFKFTNNPILTTPPVLEPLPQEEETSYTSLTHTFETLFIPNLSASFTYNFYEVNEDSLEFAKRKTYLGDLRKSPMFIKLNWTKAPILPIEIYDQLRRYGSMIEELGRLLRFPPPPPPPDDPPGNIVVIPEGAGSYIDGVYLGASTEAAMRALMQSGGSTNFLSSLVFDSPPPPTSDPLISDATRAAVDVLGRSNLGSSLFPASSPTPSNPLAEVDSRFRDAVMVDPTAPGGAASAIRDATIVFNPDLMEAGDIIRETINEKTRYKGYVIFKEILNEDGTYSTVDLFVIPDINTTSYYDYKVAYGKVYRYRIRSVLKFINKDNRRIVPDSDTFLSSGSFQQYFGGLNSARSFYFDGELSSPAEVETLEFEKPPPPELKVMPNSKDREIFLMWRQKDSSRDVLGYNVFRRRLEDDEYQKINFEALDKRTNYFVDKDVEVDQKYVYCVESFDVHFNYSKLSNQYIANIKYIDYQSKSSCEDPVHIHEFFGMDLGERRVTFDNLKIFKRKFKIVINPFFRVARNEGRYLFKIKSLDTGEEKEIKINFRNLIVNTEPSEVRREFLEQVDLRDQRFGLNSDAAQQVRDAGSVIDSNAATQFLDILRRS